MKEKLNRIKEVIESVDKTQSYLADKLEISTNAVNNLCANRSQPSLKRLYEIADHLDVDVCELLISNSKKVPTVTVTNGTKNLDPQRTHERLVDLLNKFFGSERFAVIPQTIGVGDYQNIDSTQLQSGTGLLVTANNLAGGDVADVQLYQLIETYLKDADKRAAINDFL